MKSYTTEVDGQRAFYERVGINPELSHNTDGVDRGNLYENKLSIDNIYKVLFQAVKYASRIRERGEKLPANLILNDLNKETVYIFQSVDVLFSPTKYWRNQGLVKKQFADGFLCNRKEFHASITKQILCRCCSNMN